MVKFVLLALTALAVSACDRPMMVYNGCNGSWVRIHDGRGRLLVSRLPYGQEAELDVQGYQGSSIELLAAGFELGTDRPLGSTRTTRSIPWSGGFGGNVAGPSQMQSWQISSLQTTDPNGGCRR